MAEVEVHEENVNLLMTEQEANVLVVLLASLDFENAGPLADVLVKLAEAGVNGYADLQVVVVDPQISIYQKGE